jgi:hypothetical protein
MAKLGRRTKYNPDFHPHDFIEKSKAGDVLSQIAASWGVHRDTVYEWQDKHADFSDAVKKGRLLSEAWYIKIGKAAMLGEAYDKATGKKLHVQLGFYVWLTKNLFKWSDRVETEQEVKAQVKEITYEAEWGSTSEASKSKDEG